MGGVVFYGVILSPVSILSLPASRTRGNKICVSAATESIGETVSHLLWGGVVGGGGWVECR